MYPFVVCSTFEWLAGDERSTSLLLLLAIVLGEFVCEFLLHPLLFAFAVGFLLMRNLGRFHESRFSELDWAQHAFVTLVQVNTCIPSRMV
jgi:hypothetical protein